MNTNSADSNPKTIVVIHCLAEPGLMQTLQSLEKNVGFSSAEVVVVVNHAEAEAESLKAFNQKLLSEVQTTTFLNPTFSVHCIAAFDLPQKKSGVGMARKIGMDAAVARFKQVG